MLRTPPIDASKYIVIKDSTNWLHHHVYNQVVHGPPYKDRGVAWCLKEIGATNYFRIFKISQKQTS